MSASQNGTIRWDENALRRFETNKSTSSQSSFEENEKQDWSITTQEKDSWANKERRRSSVWNGLDAPGVHKNRANSNTNPERRGSILSLWSSGKDADGNHILHHDDHEEVAVIEEGQVVEKEITSPGLNPQSRRRGSILSMWKSGTDEKGRAIIHHDDDD